MKFNEKLVYLRKRKEFCNSIKNIKNNSSINL